MQRGTIPAGRVISGARRSVVEEYYTTVDWQSYESVRLVLNAFETHLLRLQQFNEAEYGRLAKLLSRDQLVVEDARITRPGHEGMLEDVVDARLSVDLDQLRLNIGRIRTAITEDPALAIGSAKELVEATCKAILEEIGAPVPDNADIPELVHQVLDQLDLVAKNVPDEKKGAKAIKRVLGSLSQVVQGIAELRNLYGSGHGRRPGERGLSVRHAKLCAGAASTLSTFLMETAVQRRTA